MAKCTINGKEYAFSVGDRVKTIAPTGVGTVVGIVNIGYLVSLDNYAGEGHMGALCELLAGKPAPDKSNWWFDESNLTLVAPETKSLHITTDGKTTHAVLKDGNKVVKRSKAICKPADTFDFEIGARVAFDRLISPEVREVKRRAKVGEWVKVVTNHYTCYDEYKNGDILQIVEYTEPTTVKNAAYYKNQRRKYLCDYEYVVLEGYQPPTEPELPKFTYEGFKRGDFIVNCRTQEEADIFCAYLHGKGDKWCDGGNYIQNTEWRIFLENTCYSCGGSYCEKAFYESEGHTVIPFNAADLD